MAVFQVLLLLLLPLVPCLPHPQASHHIYSDSDLLAVDSQINSYSVAVPPPQAFLDQLARESHVVSRKEFLPTPLPRKKIASGGKNLFENVCFIYLFSNLISDTGINKHCRFIIVHSSLISISSSLISLSDINNLQ